MKRFNLGVLFFVAVLSLLSTSLHAAAVFWKDGTAGYLNDANNWTGDVLPGVNDWTGIGGGAVGFAIAHVDADHQMPTNIMGQNIGYTAAGGGLGAALYQTGGALTYTGVYGGNFLGYNEYGYQSLSGGQFNWCTTGGDYLRIGGYDTGIYEQSGGTAVGGAAAYGVFVGGLEFGTSTGTGVMNLSGGTFQLNPQAWWVAVCVGYQGTSSGVLNIGGTAEMDLQGTSATRGGIVVGYGTGSGVVNLGGSGYLKNAGYIKPSNGAEGTGVFNFHGGTLQATESTAGSVGGLNPPDPTSFMDSIGHAYIYSEGAKIRVEAGHSSLINQGFEDPSGSGVKTIAVTGSGGYKAPPLVTIGTDGAGTGATAIAEMEDDGAGGLKIKNIKITNPGIDYDSNYLPTVTLSGGGGTYTSANITAVEANAAGTFTKSGAGVLTLGGWNYYTGDTLVTEGTLAVTGMISGAVKVSQGAALAGTGSVYGTVTVEGSGTAGGALSPGVSATPIGTLNLSNHLYLQDGSKMVFDVSNGSSDLINVQNGDVLENPTGDPVTVNVSWTGSSTSQVTLLQVDSTHSLDNAANPKITFNWLKPQLDSFDGTTSSQATPEILRGLGGYVKLNPAGAIMDPAWNTSASGNWHDSSKWGPPNDIPNAGDERAMFTKNQGVGNVSIAVNLNADTEISSMIFNNPGGFGGGGESYTINGTNTITLNSSIATDWQITVLGGEHAVNANVKMARGTDQAVVRLNDDTHLTLGGAVGDMTAGVPSNLNFKGNFSNGAYDGMGTGKLTLSGLNTYTGKTTVEDGILELKSLGNVESANTLGMSGAEPANLVLTDSTLQYTGPDDGSTNRGVTLAGNVALQFDNNASIAGQIAATGTTVVKTGPATLTFNSTAEGLTNSLGDLLQVSQGTVAFAGGAADTSYAVANAMVGYGGIGALTAGGSSNVNFSSSLQVGLDANSLSGIGTMNVGDSANVYARLLYIGGTNESAASGSGIVNQSGGALSVIGTMIGGGGYGYQKISGGTLRWSVGASDYQWIGFNYSSVFEQTGGTVTAVEPSYDVMIGGNLSDDSTATGVMNVSDGTYALNNTWWPLGVIAGYNGTATGILNLGGDAVMDLKGSEGTVNGLLIVGYRGGSGIVNLGGNSLLTNVGFVKNLPQDSATPGTGVFNFHGGTLVASESTAALSESDPVPSVTPSNISSFMDSLAHAYIYPEGAKIKVEAGHSSQIDQVFEDPTGNGLTTVSISITNGGSGYIAPPVVTISGGGGAGATAVAAIDSEGHVTGITITNPGTDYTSAPDIILTGGGGIDAVAAANPAQFVANTGGDFQKLGDGELFLNAAGTYTGKTLVKGGTLKIADVQNGGTPSPIGQSAAGPENLVLDGGALYYSGPVAATDRGFTVGPAGGTVKTDNHLTFSGDVAGTSTDGLAKDGEGTLTLTGDLAYTGTTDIKAGLLEIGHTAGPVDLPGGVVSSTGAGDLAVLDGVALTTPSITVRALTIGGSGVSPAPAPVPEPGTWLLLALAGLAALSAARRRT